MDFESFFPTFHKRLVTFQMLYRQPSDMGRYFLINKHKAGPCIIFSSDESVMSRIGLVKKMVGIIDDTGLQLWQG